MWYDVLENNPCMVHFVGCTITELPGGVQPNKLSEVGKWGKLAIEALYTEGMSQCGAD
jgi:hypothetical protein